VRARIEKGIEGILLLGYAQHTIYVGAKPDSGIELHTGMSFGHRSTHLNAAVPTAAAAQALGTASSGLPLHFSAHRTIPMPSIRSTFPHIFSVLGGQAPLTAEGM